MKSALTTRFVLSAAAFLAAAASHADAQWATQSLHPVGAVQSAVWGVGDGQMTGIVSYVGTWSYLKATLWDMAGTLTDLHPDHLGGTVSMGFACAGGVQVGETYYSDPNIGGPQFASAWAGTKESCVVLSPEGFDAYATDGRYHAGAAFVADEIHAVVWDGTTGTWEDLDPAGSIGSYAWGAGGGQQCGHAVVSGLTQAALWTGTAGSWINLNPFEGGSSQAYGTDGVQQVGWTLVGQEGHACLWNGDAASWVDLQPDGTTASYAYDVEGGYQAGGVYANGSMHAALWQGTKESWLDLHQYLPAEYQAGDSEAWAIWVDGPNIYVGGDALNAVTGQMEAILWKFEVNRPPVAVAGDDQTVYVDPDTNMAVFGLDGSGSSDPDGDTLTYEWTDPIGQTIDTAWMGATQTPGTYVYTLKVTDPDGLSDTDTVTVTVLPANHPPVANAGPDQTVTVPHDGDPVTRSVLVTLDGSLSADPDGDALSYSWSENGVVVGTTKVLSLEVVHDYWQGWVNHRSFVLEVTDSAGARSQDVVVVNVKTEQNSPPEPRIAGLTIKKYNRTYLEIYPPHDGKVGGIVTVTFDASGSFDPDGDPLSFLWQGFNIGLQTTSTYSETVGIPAPGSAPNTKTLDLKLSDPYESSWVYTGYKVYPEPDVAPVAVRDDVETTGSQPVNFFPLNNDYDPEGDFFTFTNLTLIASVGTVHMLGYNAYSYQAPLGWKGTATVSYTIADVYGLKSTGEVRIKVK
ncbi:MAG: hypothetical protein HZC36_11425 [Armatimonadetes bacterium]|nr:hypothetical protein [Armatimonadota bacterium]